MPWSASSSLMPLVGSLSQSLVLPEASTATPSSELVAPLPWLEMRLMSSGSGWSEVWIFPGQDLLSDSGWVDKKMHSPLVLASVVSAWALMPPWSWSVLLGEQSHFLYLGLMVGLKSRYLMWVLVAGVSHMGITGGDGVQAWHTGLVMNAGASEPSNAGVVLSTVASTMGCMTVVSTSLTEHTGPVLVLAVAERNQGKAPPNWLDSFERGPSWIWCPPA